MKKFPRRDDTNAGFTVIEIVIVLAIAGLILLIVLFAIPTLQRNSRNNQRVQDVQGILEAVSHWELNNSGNIPGSMPDALTDSKAKLSYYDVPNIHIQGGNSGWTPAPNPATQIDLATSIENVYVYNYQKCDPGSPGKSTATGAGYSDVVALYAIETSGNPQPKCQQL